MPNENGCANNREQSKKKLVCVNDLRHAEYYAMQAVFDDLYARSRNRGVFTDLMQWILTRENILLAYRNMKTNSGSRTPGTDNVTISDIGRLTSDDVVAEVTRRIGKSRRGYVPKAVRRKDIPKPNGKTRPLGIPCMWDRLIQQCIKQVMEPICEAKFSKNSYGFRPDRSAEHAIAAVYHGERYVTQCQAFYSGDVALPDVQKETYQGIAVYTATAELPTGEIEYQVEGTATYEALRNGAIPLPVLILSVGAAVVIVTALLILAVLAKRRKKQNNQP